LVSAAIRRYEQRKNFESFIQRVQKRVWCGRRTAEFSRRGSRSDLVAQLLDIAKKAARKDLPNDGGGRGGFRKGVTMAHRDKFRYRSSRATLEQGIQQGWGLEGRVRVID